MNTYQITPDNKEQEKTIINQILTNKAIDHKIHIVNTKIIPLTQYSKQNGQPSHIKAQTPEPSINCSATQN
jgi:nicotinamidase-related amidase